MSLSLALLDAQTKCDVSAALGNVKGTMGAAAPSGHLCAYLLQVLMILSHCLYLGPVLSWPLPVLMPLHDLPGADAAIAADMASPAWALVLQHMRPAQQLAQVVVEELPGM